MSNKRVKRIGREIKIEEGERERERERERETYSGGQGRGVLPQPSSLVLGLTVDETGIYEYSSR